MMMLMPGNHSVVIIVLLPACSKSLWGMVSLIPEEKNPSLRFFVEAQNVE
jgi:hypothetical protein